VQLSNSFLSARRQRVATLLSFCLSPEFHQPLFCFCGDEPGFQKLIKRLFLAHFCCSFGVEFNENVRWAFFVSSGKRLNNYSNSGKYLKKQKVGKMPYL